MIEFEGVSFSYDQNAQFKFKDLKLEQGSHWLILGASGSGKTTLLHLLSGLLRPQSGSIKISGKDIARISETELDKFRGKEIGLVFQKAHLVSVLSVKDNLALAQYLAGLPQDSGRIKEVLAELQLESKMNSKPHQLSQGEQQRVTIARAVLNKPSVIFADEPTSALDDMNTEKVMNLLENQAKKYNATLVIVTHDQRLKGRISNQIKLETI
ncbi:ABC transporter ATP-binding protein [Fulvivirgaceae bacterium LMO-SS25]